MACAELCFSLLNSQFSIKNNMSKLSINQWAEDDRPREKMMRLGAQALSNAELLAILIGSGSPEESAVEQRSHDIG